MGGYMSINKYDLYAVVLAALLASVSFCAKAGVFVDFGYSTFQKPPNGIWWQDQYPNTFSLESSSIRLG